MGAREVRCNHFHACEKLAWVLGHLQSEKVLDLGGRDQQRDAVGKANHNGTWNEAHCGAQSAESQKQQDHTGHHGDHEQPGEAVFRQDPRNNHHERPRGTTDLHPRSAQE